MWIYPKALPEALRGLPARVVSQMEGVTTPEQHEKQREVALLRARKLAFYDRVFNGAREAAAVTHLGENKIRAMAERNERGWRWVD